MDILIVLLIILLVGLVALSLVLVAMIITISRSVTRAQKNIKNISTQIDDAAMVASTASAVAGLFAKARSKVGKKSSGSTKRGK